MRPRFPFPLFVAFNSLATGPLPLISGVEDSDSDWDSFPSSWSGWTCDELTPALCDLDVAEGDIDVRGGLKVHYWRYRRADNDSFREDGESGAKLPILMLHGGPGWPHGYMLPLKQQACRGRDVYFYDQAGCGESPLPPGTSVSDDFPWLLDPNYYATEELPTVVKSLNLDHFHLLGSSWGTILAQIYALDSNPGDRLASMVLSGPLSDVQEYIKAQWDRKDGSLGRLPPFMQSRIRALEAAKDYGSLEYASLDDVLTTFFTVRTAPAPDCFMASAKKFNSDIYVGMQGPSEFAIGGTLEHFSTTSRLGELGMPVLLTSGRYDTMRPSIVRVMEEKIPLAEWALLERSGHCSMIDEPGPMNDVVAEFLDRTEAFFKGDKFISKRRAPSLEMEISKEATVSYSPFGMIAGTVLAFALGVLVGNSRGTRNRRSGYDPVMDA